MKECVRCGVESESFFEALFKYFVCDVCRKDQEEWHYGTDVTINDMERQLAERPIDKSKN